MIIMSISLLFGHRGDGNMARPKCCRRIDGEPAFRIFKPAGAPRVVLEEILLAMDEFEAIRLADFEGLYHEEAAARMNVSRQTFGRIIEGARGKVARVLVEGLALRIEGGGMEVAAKRTLDAFSANTGGVCPTEPADRRYALSAGATISLVPKKNEEWAELDGDAEALHLKSPHELPRPTV